MTATTVLIARGNTLQDCAFFGELALSRSGDERELMMNLRINLKRLALGILLLGGVGSTASAQLVDELIRAGLNESKRAQENNAENLPVLQDVKLARQCGAVSRPFARCSAVFDG
jgi:hypothetical protein